LCSPPIRFLRLPLGFSADVLLAALFLCIRPPTTELYPLSLHDALPISPRGRNTSTPLCLGTTSPICTSTWCRDIRARPGNTGERSEEHTSELQSREKLVCRLLLEKKKSGERHHPDRGVDRGVGGGGGAD